MRVKLWLALAVAAFMASSPALAKKVPATKAPAIKADSAMNALTGEMSIAGVEAAMKRGTFTSEALTQAAIARIKALDGRLHAVIAINPDALAEARAVDSARRAGKPLGPMAGIPVLIKDNIETLDPMATTAGSLALKDNITHRDAPVIARLRAAGAVILAKTNLSKWANIRSSHAMSGWSAVGGLVANPYDLTRTACGSSSGTGAGIAADYAVIGIGTETDGSVTCPLSMQGLTGLKPTVGLVSRTHIVPISHSQDTAGPMGHSVADIAALLSVMAGSDPADAATNEADAHKADYTAGLSKDALKGMRIGVLRDEIGSEPKTAAVFEKALQSLKAAGAVLVDIPKSDVTGLGDAENTVLMVELKADLNAYLATTPAAVKTRTLADLIAFNTAHAATEMPYFQQELFEDAEKTKGLSDPDYITALAKDRSSQARIDGLLKDNNVALLIAPTYAPAWLSDPIYGDVYNGPSATSLPATAGYPHLTVPMGAVQGMPVGLSFIGPKWSEAML
ncbi:MAG: amidase, partial [Asticcacaulis sp.]